MDELESRKGQDAQAEQNAQAGQNGQPEQERQIIAGTYEIVKRIGAGGAGIVYLGRHTRLGKDVVLKADKRKLTTKAEVLRREVDALKNLSHSYIPQVYDFVQEGETVYTVMDYIEGESLDKPLERGERFSQAQVIEWGCQLLEALVYLHSRPPHGILHSDIKPANIMVTPQNDIRLIDFNIALALGEEGSVRVGFSRGYASPEHYGIDFTSDGTLTKEEQTVLTEEGATWSESVRQSRLTGSSTTGSSTGSTTRGKKTVLLDVRSDIYSAGATLYHMLTGVRPSQDARNVQAITGAGISPAVAAIIMKAMAPNPDDRYQTAAEMLYAFEHLHESDPRTKRRKRRISVTAAVLAACFLLGGGSAFLGQRMKTAEEAEAKRIAIQQEEEERRTKQALQLVEASRSSLAEGDRPNAAEQAAQALELGTIYDVNAEEALSEALGVYDLADGFQAKGVIELPSEPLKVLLSPRGTRLCAIYAWEMAVFDTDSGEALARRPIEESALSEALFLDENRIVYAAPGAIRAYDLASGTELWSGEAGTRLCASADGTRVAAIYKDRPEAHIYDARTGEKMQTVSFGEHFQRVLPNDLFADTKDNLLALNAEGSLLGVSFADGSVRVFNLQDSEADIELLEPSQYVHFEGGFSGKYFALSAYTSAGGGDSILAIVDTEALRVAANSALQTPFHIQADESGIYIANNNVVTRFDMENATQKELVYTERDVNSFRHAGAYTVAATTDHQFRFFNEQARETAIDTVLAGYSCDFADLAGDTAVIGSMDSPYLRLLELVQHPEAQLFSYDPAYPHSEARLSADGETVMLFRHDHFRIYTMDGETVCDVDFPDASRVYDTQFRREGTESRLEVFYNDGLIRSYSARDGALLSETQAPKPDMSLYEEFYTDRYRLTSPLHGAPEAYDRETGELVRELEKDVLLTYATQVGDYIITEYITAREGLRYGMLLNAELETLAYLPNLCDIYEGRLLFDYSSGDLRQSPIYSREELLALAGK
ncbi:MAG: protein kinase [Oscillospiraceae bacterium]|nr:protein kinase [Oscillospiraceae bacterium]